MARGSDDRTRKLDRTVAGTLETSLQLLVLSGEKKGAQIELPTGRPVFVGSSVEATLQLPDSAVSRLHLELSSEGARVRARDLESTNGSFYEGTRFERIELSPGAIIRVGETELQVMAPDAAPQLPPSEATAFGPLLGRSRKMRDCFAVLERAAQSDSTVLITGETGTGKEVAAEAIHFASRRADRPLVIVDCAALHANLVESELFGHLKGSFTGATSDRAGAFIEADGGTVFLDEIGELPAEMQPRLLRALESRSVKAVGSNEFKKIDVRVIAATNRDLPAEVAAKRFRSDLYYRLAVIGVHLPSLRERREDIPLLARHFAQQISARGGREIDPTPQMMAALMSYGWPGNVRELRNVIQQAASLSTTSLGLALELASGGQEKVSPLGMEALFELPFKEARKQAVESFEIAYLENALERAGGNVSRAAEQVGLHRNMIHRILARKKGDQPDED